MGDSPITSQWMALQAAGTDVPPIYNDGQLISENIWGWVLKTLGAPFTAPYTPYPVYSDPASNNGIFRIPKAPGEPVSIALLADWASDTVESQLIGSQAGPDNDYSVHLGDTYFIGKQDEIAANFYKESGGTWPYATLGSFAIPGNHEMYSGGTAYFEGLLPRMGSYNAAGIEQPQQASFFCLENDYWRIIGLDTGYESLTPPLHLAQNPALDITPEQKQWLQDIVKLNDDQRGIILLTHHQCFSAFEPEFPNPMSSISTLMNPGRDLIWLWGHEHWFAVYGANQLHNGANVFARCIGNSGMPVELTVNGGIKQPKNNLPHMPENRNLVIYDQRQREVINGNVPLGHNGYVIATLNDANLTLSYFDDNGGAGAGRKLLEENWTIDTTTGKLTGQSITDLTANGINTAAEQLSPFIGANLTDAITPTS